MLKVCIPLYDLTGLQVEDPGTTSNPTYATLTTPDFIVTRNGHGVLPRAASGRVGVAHLLFRWHKYIYRIV